MTNSRICTVWGLAASAILLAPIIVIFFIPLTIGVGLDIFDLVGETPFALALCAPAAFVLVRQVASRALMHQLAALLRPRLPLFRSAELN
jgi:hypothetical protein